MSNRLPVAWDEHSGWQRAPGGLVTALEAITRTEQVSWIGSAATVASSDGQVPPGWPHGLLHAVQLDPATVSGAVDIACNSALWPALHGLRHLVRWRNDPWNHYVDYNQAFVDEVERVAAPGDQVWFHDFHLLLAPGLVAARRPDLRVGLSLHTPVDANAVAALECGGEVADALRRVPLIGTQTDDDRAEVERLFELYPRPGSDRSSATVMPVVVTSPVSVDVRELTSLAADPVVRSLARRRREAAAPRSLVIGVDRLDPTKGIVERLDAYDRAYARGLVDPEDVDIFQIAVPSRTHVPLYAALRVDTERRLHAMKSRWQRADGSSPIEIVFESAGPRQIAALMLAADVCMVTPRRDGMNLVAKEFAVLNGSRSGYGSGGVGRESAGVLVLSNGAGASKELAGCCIPVDGADPASVARGFEDALATPGKLRAEMAAEGARRVARWTATDWSQGFTRLLTAADPRPGPRIGVGRCDALSCPSR